MIKVIELFAGIGAQTQALKEANIEHEVVAISEIDKYALKAYELLHGKVSNLGDIKKIKYLPEADMWTYSFPCTDISLAGKMKGFEKGTGTNSSLLWEVQRLLKISELNNELPKFLIMENVKNLVSKKFMPLFQMWLDFLVSLGYKNSWKVMNAKDYGVPQNRERVFMISILNGQADFVFPEKEELKVKLLDLLEKEVDEKYFLSSKLISNFSSLENRNGFIRGLRFRPHELDSKFAWAISTCPGSRATDNFIVVPMMAAMRGRLNNEQNYEQQLEINLEGISNTITTVQKDNLVVIVPENTKQGYAIAEVGDGVYTNRTASKRGVVQKSKIPSLKTSVHDIGVVVAKEDIISIRRLTPRECWRLMGWKDELIDTAFGQGISETQLYKMAGNSIVLKCLLNLFLDLFINQKVL